MASVTFEFASDDIEHFDLIIQPATNSPEQHFMIRNPETFSLVDGVSYVYMLRVVGNPGASYTLTIEGATQANSPIERKVPSGLARDSYLDQLIA